jgi:mannose/fructose/N-acetylgalactosamine-specific phosphotransferase system component IIC
VLVVSILGGFLALDATAVGQFMVSRPLVAGVIAGSLAGDAVTGLLIGSTLELYHLAIVPAGGGRFPETGPATVVAATVAVWTGGTPGAIAIAWALGLLWSQVGGWTVSLQRRLNGVILGRVVGEGGSPAALEVAHALAILSDLSRGVLLTAVGLLIGITVVPGLAALWPLDSAWTVGLILTGASVSLGILYKGFGGWPAQRVLFVAGLVAGLVGAYLL